MINNTLQTKLEEIFKAHIKAELAGDLDEALATMRENPHLVNVPTMIGGEGQKGVQRFYSKRLIGQFFPLDVMFERVSRTYTEGQLIDELIISFTHTHKIDWMLPGVEPTGERVESVFVVIVASLLIQQEANVKYIQQQLGHGSIAITLDIYSHLFHGDHRHHVSALDDAQDMDAPKAEIT